MANPYRPGAGRRPPVLAGRGQLLQAFDVLVRRAETLGEGDRGWILHGLRGVGKTALLMEMLAQVSGREWITAKVEVTGSAPLSRTLSQELGRSLRTATGPHPMSVLRRLIGVFKAFSLRLDPSGAVTVGIEAEPISGVADSGNLPDDLAALFEVLGDTARDLGRGVLILVDELQEASGEELTAVNTAAHRVGQVDPPLPLIVVGAGLPSLPAQLAEATSYAERLYDYRTIGRLDEAASHEALVLPAEKKRVQWDDDALAEALDAAGGYPYFLQAIGKHVWDNARRTPIDFDDVVVGLKDARQELDDGLYRSRWERATRAQREFLRAAASLDAESFAVADVASALGKRRSSDVSVARNELIKKGLVYAPERGQLAFTVPGMREFIGRTP